MRTGVGHSSKTLLNRRASLHRYGVIASLQSGRMQSSCSQNRHSLATFIWIGRRCSNHARFAARSLLVRRRAL